MTRIKDKKEEIHNYLDELEKIVPEDFEEYKNNHLVKAACERYFEKIMNAVTDLGFIIIKENKLRVPEEEKELFDILEQENIVNKELARKLKEARGMRNIIAHQYGKINDEIVFEAITSELIKDVGEFLDLLK